MSSLAHLNTDTPRVKTASYGIGGPREYKNREEAGLHINGAFMLVA
jgi:hypothetical protein